MSRRTLPLLLLPLVACGGEDAVTPPPVAPMPTASAKPSEPPDLTQDAPFRDKAPLADGPLAVRAPDVVEKKLSNGIRVLFVTRKALPLFAVRVGTLSGALDEPTMLPLVATATGALLEMGTKKFNAEGYSEAFDAIGGRHSASIGWTGGAVAGEGPTEALDRVIELVASAVTEPAFPETELRRLKDRWKSQLEMQRTSPRWLTWNTLGRVIVGEKSPLSHPPAGRPEEIEALTRAPLVAYHQRAFVAENLGIAIAGDVSPDAVLPKLEAAFGKVRKGKVARTSPVPDAAKARLLFVEKKGATQSQVTAVLPGPTLENDPDYEATEVADAIFGGMFSSRLNLNLREAHAYTYGARSSFFEHRSYSLLTAGGAIVREHTNDAIEEVKKEFARFAANGATESELADAKEYLRLNQVRSYETVWETTAVLGDLLQHGKGPDELAKRAERLERVRLVDVNRVAKARYSPEKLSIVVVGDDSVRTEQLSKQSLAPVEVRGPLGEPSSEKASTTDKKSEPTEKGSSKGGDAKKTKGPIL